MLKLTITENCFSFTTEKFNCKLLRQTVNFFPFKVHFSLLPKIFVMVLVALLFGETVDITEATIVEESDSNDLDQVSLQVYPMSEEKINTKAFFLGFGLLVVQALVSASIKGVQFC